MPDELREPRGAVWRGLAHGRRVMSSMQDRSTALGIEVERCTWPLTTLWLTPNSWIAISR